MSIKKLFDSTNRVTQYADFDNEKGAYSTVESSANAKNLTIEQATFVPDLDYSNPEKFAFYGSAYLYYKSAFDNVSDYYPYDGSLAEQSAFYNKMLPVDKYVFNKKYPRTTGYAIFSADGWGTTTKTDGYGLPNTLEYIAFKGGPHTGSQGTSLKNQSLDKHSSKIDRSNVYDDDIYASAGLPSDYGKGTRLSNLRSNFDNGVTVEFWLKTGSINTALTEKQVVFDLWNNEATGSGAMDGTPNNSYGRIRIELVSGSSSGLPTKIMTYTVQSGSTKKTSTIGATGSATFSDWKHYAVAFYNTGSSFITKLYVDGKLDETITSAGAVSELNPAGMQARIGALATSPFGSTAPAGAGKLSGSIDEFRFWKVARNASQIGVNYFDRIGGGSNTDISNATLGVYFKFNEGITGVTATDNIVADYSGRISNGTWTGYSATSRNTGSAIVSASAAAAEFEDPIIRENHPDYISARKSLLDIGSHYDSTNHSGFINHAPSWVIENHEDVTNDNLKIISHIVGSYFDNLYILTREFPKFKQVNYLSESASPIPFANHLPQSLGLYVPDIFIDATVQEQLMNRNETEIFQSNLDETKNLIYQNLYNNLANIYKAKGTENAFKNVLRCFNIDDEMVQLKIYSDNNIYEIKNNLRQIISTNKSANFNKQGQTAAVVYQRKDTTNGNSRGFISGSAGGATGGAGREKYYGFTAEADVIFPRFFNTKDTIDRSFKQVSLFGAVGLAHPETTAHQQGTNTSTPRTGSASRLANFQVYAIRDEAKSKNVYFKLESSGSANPFPTLTSSYFNNVYDNSRWNLSVRLKPTSVGLSGLVSGSSLTYDLIFRGVNSVLGVVKNSFEVSSSISATTGSNFLQNHKRVYAGAFRNNLTGTMIHPSDVKMSNVKYWLKHLENSDLELHLNDVENSGISGSYKNISALDTSTNTFSNLNKDTLALEWNFDLLTGSDAAGNFVTQDFSSGSSTIRNNYGWLGKITGYQHNGYGNFFNASSTDVVDRERVNSFKFVDPEEVVSSNMISILNDDDELLGFEQTIPNYVITAEKSMYRAISEEMLIFFAGVVDFNNIVGAPVNRYRGRYKDLEFMREAFFRRVKETKDIEKFISYYKWFDSAITEIFSQLVPASANFVEGVTNLIESHVLERNKYRTPFPSIDAKQPDPVTSIYGIGESTYPYETGFTPLPSSPRRTDIQVDYWKKRAERNAVEITSGDVTIDTQRDNIRRIINSNPVLSSSRDDIFVNDNAGTQYQPELYARRNYQQLSQIHTDEPNSNTYGGGTNFSKDKNIQFSKVALSPGGPVNTAGGVYVPQNILLSFVNDFVAITDFKDPSKTPWKKVKRVVPVDYGRHHDDKDGYYHVKSSKAFPFNIISSSLNSGYQSEVSAALGLNLEITNVHNDVYGDDQEKPLQGIFTEHNVGGNQHRHAPLNTGADNNNNRPEAWRILLGTCTASPSGAIGMVGADYPMSPAYVAPPGANQPYPHADYPRATHFRDMVAKRPLNIRNIKITGSSVLGNYRNTYEYVHTFGAFSNPRQFVEQQPTLPTNVFHLKATSSTSVRTFLDTKPTRDHDTVNREHFNFVSDYSVSYLTGTTNKSVIKTRFSAPGGIEVMTPGYTDFRSDEFSVYNALPYKNLSVIKPSQGPSGSISETFGMRVSDIHNLDFGLRSHLARHTARFGRDSNLALNPGAAYAESPGMHKVHRNNLQRDRILTERSVPIMSGISLDNRKAIYWGADNGRGMQLINADSASASTFLSASRNHGFSYAGWVRFSPDFNQGHLYSIGKSGQGDAFFELQKNYAGAAHRLLLHVQTRDTNPHTGNPQRAKFYITSSILDDGNWHHLAVVCPTGSSAAKIGTAISMYIDGTAFPIVTGTIPYAYFDQKMSTGVTMIRSSVGRTGNTALVLGGESAALGAGLGSQIFSGSMNNVTLWRGPLSANDVASLYNGGTPCDVTSSTAYLSPTNDTDLFAWYKMTDVEHNDEIKVVAGNAFNSSSNAVWDWNPNKLGRNLFPMVYLGQDLATLTQSFTEHPVPLEGCVETLIGYDEQRTFYSGSEYDNFFVKHQIPRSSRQYAWITASLVSTNGHVGFTPDDFKISSSAGYVDAYDFITASQVGSSLVSGQRRFGVYAAGYVPQVSDLNLNIYEPVTSSTNTLGQGAANVRGYVNKSDALVDVALVGASPNAFNNLMFKRGNQYGFPSWKQMRTAQHPIVRQQRTENKLQVMVENAPRTFEVSPVNLNNKIQEIGVRAINGTRYVMRATHQPTFFDTPELNNLLISPDANARITPMQAVIASAYRSETIKNIDYIVYTEDVFPSGKNQFTSHSSERIGYSNDYWHSNREQRNILGATLYTGSEDFKPRITGSYYRRSAMGYDISASAWSLDAATDFLTRRGETAWNGSTNGARVLYGELPHRNYSWQATDGAPGELQNTLQSYFVWGNTYPTASESVHDADARKYFNSDAKRAYNALAGPLYARKHFLGSPTSVTNPNSITNHIAGRNGDNVPPTVARLGFSSPAGPSATPFTDRHGNILTGTFGAAKIFAGEALWEAATNAAIFTKIEIHSSGTNVTRKAAPSVPAYDSYAKFVDSIKRQSRDKSIVPEYRISRNLPEYLEYGSPFVPSKQDHFDIPGTNINSSQQEFYLDYSNSEFLKYFASVSRDSGLQPAEIQLVCSASIKFHPYKGFFPAQRTMELATEFKNSYQDMMRVNLKKSSDVGSTSYTGRKVLEIVPGAFRPVMQAYFSPGILYNTIKSGIAVDYPILYNRFKMLPNSHYTSYVYSSSWGGPALPAVPAKKGAPYTPDVSDYMIANRISTFLTAANFAELSDQPSPITALDRGFGSFWDQRVPFEAIMDPNMLANTQFADCEPHPSATINAAASYEPTSDQTYTLMAKNFFGGIADFYLRGSEFTSLRSETVYKDDYRFDSGSVYMARIKMRRSVTGSRDYSFESGSFMKESYTQGGGTALLPRLYTPDDTTNQMYDVNAYFELPQDPIYAPDFYETFTMYSRPSAFGPPVAGHRAIPTSSHVYHGFPKGITPSAPYTGSAFRTASMQVMDSLKGYNWSFTPPYYNGEAWADLIFRPQADISYDLERILAETRVNYWRVDPGPKLEQWGIQYAAGGLSLIGISGNIGSAVDDRYAYGYTAPGAGFLGFTSLIHDPQVYEQWGAVNTAPYAGSSINGNAMQLSASMNLFGVERVFKKTSTETIAGEVEVTNEVVGKKWIISTKFETPMLNFNDKFQAQPVTASVTGAFGAPALGDFSNSTKTLPTFGSSSAPNGMWHQFGSLPTDKKTGVFIEINDMPKNWLRNHYHVRLTGSIYNNNVADYNGVLAKEGQVGSLRDLCGFKKSNTRSRIGELKDFATIKEAIVAVPYMITSTDEHIQDSNTFVNFEGKYLFRLPVDGATVSSGAAEAINKQIQAMNDYIVPPQFDFVNYPDNVAPVTMYFFEFSYTFDKDDLSYMWQNLMPRNHEKGLFDSATAEHTLGAEFPLEAADILNNPNMRWMVFKVKQRSQADYYDYVSTQAGDRKLDRDDDSPLQFNWPYDYCSIIEFVGVDAGVLFNNKIQTPGESTTLKYGGSITSEDKLPPENKKVPNREADSQERTPNREADSQERTPNRERDQGTTLAAADAPSSIDSSTVSSPAATPSSGDY